VVRRAEEAIVEIPDVMGGTPIIKGTWTSFAGPFVSNAGASTRSGDVPPDPSEDWHDPLITCCARLELRWAGQVETRFPVELWPQFLWRRGLFLVPTPVADRAGVETRFPRPVPFAERTRKPGLCMSLPYPPPHHIAAGKNEAPAQGRALYFSVPSGPQSKTAFASCLAWAAQRPGKHYP